MSWEEIRSFLESWFIYPGIDWYMIGIAVAVALFFGAVWMIFYRQPRFNNGWPLGVMVFSAFFTLVTIAFIQLPLQSYIDQGFTNTWDALTIRDWLLLAGLPIVLISGLVQEGAKMVPMVLWWRRRKNLDPKMGLAIGAIAGFGFGVFEAFTINTYVIGSGWTPDAIVELGFLGIAPFWERFFIVGFHIAASAMVGYGLVKGFGWQFYLIAAGAHSLVNYGTIIYQGGYLTVTQIEIYVAVVAVLTTIAALWMRYRKEKQATPEIPPLPPPEPVETPTAST